MQLSKSRIKPEPNDFFALWPDAGLAQALSGRIPLWRESFGGGIRKTTAASDLHLTLVFMGALSDGERKEVLSIAQGLAAQAFVLRLDRLGSFHRSKTLWLAPASVPPELSDLVAELRSRLETARIPVRGSGAFSPHLTLARLTEPPSGESRVIEPIDWRVTDFGLARSQPGPPYQIVERWPLITAGESRVPTGPVEVEVQETGDS